jgi:hypothetical protein
VILLLTISCSRPGGILIRFPPLPQKQALFAAIKEYENAKWKVIGQKVGKPAKACEQFAKENFPGRFFSIRISLNSHIKLLGMG